MTLNDLADITPAVVELKATDGFKRISLNGLWYEPLSGGYINRLDWYTGPNYLISYRCIAHLIADNTIQFDHPNFIFILGPDGPEVEFKNLKGETK